MENNAIYFEWNYLKFCTLLCFWVFYKNLSSIVFSQIFRNYSKNVCVYSVQGFQLISKKIIQEIFGGVKNLTFILLSITFFVISPKLSKVAPLAQKALCYSNILPFQKGTTTRQASDNFFSYIKLIWIVFRKRMQSNGRDYI